MPLLQIMRGLSSPAILIAVVWSAALVGVGVGPIDFATQPSKAVIALVATGVALFVLASEGGRWCFRVWLRRRPDLRPPTAQILNIVLTTSLSPSQKASRLPS